MAAITQIVQKGVSLADDALKYAKTCGKTSILHTKPVSPTQIEGLRMATDAVGDTVAIANKSPLGEFMAYAKGFAEHGKDYKYIAENPNSPFARYLKSIEDYNLMQSQKSVTRFGSITIKPRPPKTPNIDDFKNFLYDNADTIGISKEEYWQIVDEVANSVKQSVMNNPNGLRKEFIEHSDKIHKWAEIFRTQHFENGRNIYHKYYDEKLFNQAVKEYIEFAEKITGKKVLIGCPSRMNFPISALGMLNNPKAYEGVDYILLGHGKNSSLITNITHPDTWRFSDNNQSIWKYIEDNIPKGKKVLVFCCETEGLAKAKDAGMLTEDALAFYNKNMPGVGYMVMNSFYKNLQPAKVCKSGIRHIIGQVSENVDGAFHTEIGQVGGTANTFSLSRVKDPIFISYEDFVDFSKYKV